MPVDRTPVVMDFPAAWEFVQATDLADHDPRCSYPQTNGAVLCDCDVLWDEYDRRKAAIGA